jgi:hypothetical protein
MADGGSIATQHIVKTLPFDLYLNLVFIKVRVNGSQPLSFNLDSGLQTSILDSARARELGLELKESTTVDVPGGKLELAFADGVTLQLPGLALPEQRVRTLPLSVFSPVLGRPIEGTLGHDIFNQYVVEIDYEAKLVRLHDPATFTYSGPGEALPLSFDAEQAFVTALIEQPGRSPVEAKLKLDTGSADALGLNGSFVKATNLVPAGQPVLPQPGVALGGITENYVTRLGALRLGRYILNRPVVGYSKDLTRGGDAGTIGGEIFRRFKVIFDYPRQRLILEQNSHFTKPFDYDASGLFLVAEAAGPNIKVLRVTPNTPGAESGLKEGDVITAVDRSPPRSLEAVRKAFRHPGERLRVKVRREIGELELTLTLRSLI